MDYKIVIDSCGEFTPSMEEDPHFERIPLGLTIEDRYFVDDDGFDPMEFLRAVSNSKEVPRSSCPSPERFMEAFEGDFERVYVITLSSKLSGSYNSARLAKDMYLEEHKDKKICLIDSKSASVGQTLIGLEIKKCEDLCMPYDEILRVVYNYRDQQQTFFVLESLDHLIKNGRISNFKAFVATAMNIKPICGSTPEGEIRQLGQGRGMKKALAKMAQLIKDMTVHQEELTIAFSYVNNAQRAAEVRKLLKEVAPFKEIIMLPARGVTTLYAAQGGIVVAV